jgi:hypothetical protein
MVSASVANMLSCGVALDNVEAALQAGSLVQVPYPAKTSFHPAGNTSRIDMIAALGSVNVAPSGVLAGTVVLSVDENTDTSLGLLLGSLMADDANLCDLFTFGKTAGDAALTLNTSDGALTLTDGILNFETVSSYTVSVQVTDYFGLTSTVPDTFVINVNDLNEAPAFTSGANVVVQENTSNVVVLAAVDEDLPGDTLTFAKSTDADPENVDAALFSVVGNQLAFVSAPDFETPTDNGVNNVYNVSVEVSDGDITVAQDIVVTVINEIELVTVPDVIGDTQATAESAITAAQLTPATSSQGSFSAPVGTVTSQDPAAGVSVNENSAVSITVSSGAPGNPVLVYSGEFVDYTGSDGNPYRRWHFNVTNSSDYPPEMFASTSAYGPCGLNNDPARSWVDFFDASDDSRIYGFCDLGTPDNMNGIWFAEPAGTAPPASGVYIKIIDRSPGGLTYTSNVVPASALPFP